MKNTTAKTFQRKVEEGQWEVVSEMYNNYISSAYEVRDCNTGKRFTVIIKK